MMPSNPPNTSGTARLLARPPGFAVGWQQPVYLPNPVAGQSWSRKVDGRYFERLISAQYTYTTDATVGNRNLVLALLDANGAAILNVTAGVNYGATSFFTGCLMIDSPTMNYAPVNNMWGYLPDIITPPGYQWAMQVAGAGAADQFTAITLLVQQFPNDAAMVPVNS